MVKNGYKLRANQKLYIVDVSDMHVGSQQFNEAYFEYFLDILEGLDPSKTLLYFGGDLWEAASLRVGNSAFKTTMTLDEQLDFTINNFKPFKKMARKVIIGNHDARLAKDYDFNIANVFAKQMNCESAHQAIDTFNINGEPFSVHISHGKGTAAHAHTAQGKLIRETAQIQADLYIQGHNHRLDFFSQPVRTADGIKRKYYAFSGAFLGYSGYPDAMLLPILPEAFQVISVNKDFVVKSNQFYIDQRRPDLITI